MLWVLKDREVWDGAYFRDQILIGHVIPFLLDPNNVLTPGEAVFVHDKAPCMRANATQQLLQDNQVEFWGNSIWPGNSPDLNPAEHIGSIIKDRTEAAMNQETGPGRYSTDTLRLNLEHVLRSLEDDTELFQNLLCSYPSRLKAVVDAQGGHTDF